MRESRNADRSDEERRVDRHVADAYKNMAENNQYSEDEREREKQKREQAIDPDDLNSTNDT